METPTRCGLILLLLTVVLIGAAADTNLAEDSALWFQGPKGAINVEDVLLAQYGSFDGIRDEFDNMVLREAESLAESGLKNPKLQFVAKRVSKVTPDWIAELSDIIKGGHLEYFPDDAVLLYCGIAMAQRIALRADTKYIVPVRSEWKAQREAPLLHYVEPARRPGLLWQMLREDASGRRSRNAQSLPELQSLRNRNVLLSVAVATYADEEVLSAFASRMRAQLLTTSGIASTIHSVHDVSCHFVLSVRKGDVSRAMHLLSKQSRVLSIQENVPSFLYNAAGNNIAATGSPIASNPYASTLNGSGEIIHIADSGLDYFHCAFYDQSGTVTPKTSNAGRMVSTTTQERDTRRKVVSYWQFMDGAWRTSDHGTHVSGTAAGAATPGSAGILQTENGIASEAKIAFTDIGCDSSAGCTCGSTLNGAHISCPCDIESLGICDPNAEMIYPPSSVQTGLFPYGAANGAFISSNSWGASSGSGYSHYSRDVDAAAIQYSTTTVLFAAGNSGDPQTISAQGSAKNIITVGASNTGKPNILQIVTSQVNPSIDGGSEFAGLLGCLPGSTNPACLFFQSSSFDGCSTTSYCGEGYRLVGSAGCGCFPCDAEGCYRLGSVSCRSCAVAYYQNTPESQLAVDSLAFFSSTGPTSDGRIKPDVVAPGNLIVSSRSYAGSLQSAADKCGLSGLYASMSSAEPFLSSKMGTSMATPLVAGYAALVRQYLRTFYPQPAGVAAGTMPIATPPSSLLRALIIQSATPMDGVYCANGAAKNCDFPNSLNHGQTFQQGFGVVGLNTIIPAIGTVSGNTTVLAYEDGTNGLISATGAQKVYTVYMHRTECLRVTLAWTDPLASSSASKQLYNDLDLVVSNTSTSVLGNQQQSGVADHVNNVEKVLWYSAPAGPYTISVTGYRVAAAQRFSLVVSTMPSSLCVVVQENIPSHIPTSATAAKSMSHGFFAVLFFLLFLVQ
eukprot:ANDGO_03926.mRNA.1 Serine protease/ABC transporter B family protein tagD